MQTTPEWDLIQELMECLEDLDTEEQRDFVEGLFLNLDPHLGFLEQQSPKQLKWLEILHRVFVDGDEEAYEDL